MHFKRAYVIKFMVSITLMVDYYIYERSSDVILFVYSLRGALAKNARACHTRWHNLC